MFKIVSIYCNSKHCGFSPPQEIENDQSDIDKPLYDGASVTVGQSLLVIMAFVPGNNLFGAAVENLLKLLVVLLPADSQLPKTRYLFDKHFIHFKDGVQFKLCCPICNALLREIDHLECTYIKRTFFNENNNNNNNGLLSEYPLRRLFI